MCVCVFLLGGIAVMVLGQVCVCWCVCEFLLGGIAAMVLGQVCVCVLACLCV